MNKKYILTWIKKQVSSKGKPEIWLDLQPGQKVDIRKKYYHYLEPGDIFDNFFTIIPPQGETLFSISTCHRSTQYYFKFLFENFIIKCFINHAKSYIQHSKILAHWDWKSKKTRRIFKYLICEDFICIDNLSEH
jgi:hypothetical protein